MPRSFLLRLLARDVDFDVSQWFDLFRAARDTHLGARFVTDSHRPAEPNQPAAAPLAPVMATPALTESQPVLAGRFDRGPDFTVTITPAAASDPDPENLDEGGDNRLFSVQVGIGPQPQPVELPQEPLSGEGETREKPDDREGRLASSIAMNSHPLPQSREFDVAALADAGAAPADAPLDTLELSGDFSAGFTLSAMSFDISQLAVRAGSNYVLVANDNFVEPGESLLVDGRQLGADNGIMFDGTAETDGNYVFLGGGSDDFFFGGGGDDRIAGLAGGDSLTGGGGSDIFVYSGAGDSSGTDYDTIADFDPAADRIDLPGAVAGFGAAIEGGTLSTATFNADLAAAVGNLGAAQAVWFAPDAGDLAGQIFLIVDGNGRPGYQEGEDFVFAIAGAPLADLTGHTDIFI